MKRGGRTKTKIERNRREDYYIEKRIFFFSLLYKSIARVDIAEKWTRPGEFPSEEEEEEEEEEEDEGMF